MTDRIKRVQELLEKATPDPKGTGHPSEALHAARKREQQAAVAELLLEIPALLKAQEEILTMLRNLLADDLEHRGFHAQAVETRKNFKP
jgi:hypothetical protein